jgi:hypothetical protein
MTRTTRVLLLAAGLVVLAMLVRRTGVSTIAVMLRRVGWGFVAVSALYASHVAVRAAALWRSIADDALTYREVLYVRLAGEAVEMLTFTGPFFAEPAKGYLLKRRGVEGAEAFGAVAIEYLLNTLTASWMAAAALSILLSRRLLPDAFTAPALGIIAGTVAFTIGCAWASASGIGIIAPTIRLLGARNVASRVEPVERVLVGFMRRHPLRMCGVLAIEAAGHALLAAEVWVVLEALGLPLAPADPLLVEGGVKFISVAFFFIPGQVGASEGVYSLLVSALGFPAAAGLTLALVRRVRGLIVAGIGVGVLAFVQRQSGSPAA